MVSTPGGGHLHEVLRAVGSDCHDIRPEQIDLLPLGSNRSSCHVLLSAKPVLRRDLGHTRIQAPTLRSIMTNQSVKLPVTPSGWFAMVKACSSFWSRVIVIHHENAPGVGLRADAGERHLRR